MFLGAIPRDICSQITRTVPLADYDDIFVCCSGSFRMDQAFHKSAPQARIHSNDVSLYSAVIGHLATHDPLPLTFVNRLAFVEALLADASFADRAAAVLLAHEMSRYSRANAYAEKHFAYYVQNFHALLAGTSEKLAKLVAELGLASFSCCDLGEHIERAMASHSAAGRTLIAFFPPFFKGDYESQYKFLDQSIDWPKPTYELYNPKSLDSILTRFEEADLPYVCVSDQRWDHRAPKLEYVAGRKKPHFGYYSAGRSAVKHVFNKPLPFKYRAIEFDQLTPGSTVQVIRAEAGHMNFLKDVYLAKGIIHSTGLVNFLIYLDGMLVGGVIYALQKFGGGNGIYLLSDVTVSSEGRLSKLVALIATSRTLIREVEVKIMERIELVITTARTKNAVSMKYRDIYELASRRPSTDAGEEGKNILQYHSPVRAQTPQEMYQEWFAKHAAPKSPQQGRRRGKRNGSA